MRNNYKVKHIYQNGLFLVWNKKREKVYENYSTCIIAMYSILVFVCPIFRAVGDCVIRDLENIFFKFFFGPIFFWGGF